MKMSCSEEYPVVLGERHPELPKKTKARFILLPNCQLYRKTAQAVFCDKCKIEHKIYRWVLIAPKSTIAFLDVHLDKVVIVEPNENVSVPLSSGLPDEESSSLSPSPSPSLYPKSLLKTWSKHHQSLQQAKFKLTLNGNTDRNTETLTYTINITNNSSNHAHDVTIVTSLPNIGSNWLIIQPRDKCQINGNELHCRLETVASGQSVVIKVSANISRFCHSGEQRREVFSTAKADASNASAVSTECTTII